MYLIGHRSVWPDEVALIEMNEAAIKKNVGLNAA